MHKLFNKRKEMIISRSIGVWMNHSFANLIEFTSELITSVIIDSNIDKHHDDLVMAHMETKGLFKAQNLQNAYLKEVESALHNCKELILFGPNYSKVKLYHILRQNTLFANTKIKITHAEDMNETQQHAFVKGHFMAK